MAANTAPTFVTGNGKVITDFGDNALGKSVALQADGKIIVVGQANNASNGQDFAVARYNSDGSLDTSFNGSGKTTTDFGGDDYSQSIALQHDGKITVVGASTGYDFALARYNSDGSLDTSFKAGNLFNTIFKSGGDRSFSIQVDGKIIVAGDSNGDFAIARYNFDGSLDTSFSSDGWLTTDFGGNDYSKIMTLQPDGKILVAGFTIDSNNSSNIALARYNPDGSLDSSFNGVGKTTADFGGNDYSQSLTLQSDGKILVAGFTQNLTQSSFALARYNADGSLDINFSSDGLLTTDFEGNATGHCVGLQADGKIIVAGFGNGDFGIARYNPNGSLDTSFNVSGKTTTDFGGNDYAQSVIIQPDGDILVAGYTLDETIMSRFDFVFSRYNPNGSLDLSIPFYKNTIDNSLYLENSNKTLDKEVHIWDKELSQRGNYAGTSLTIVRKGNANSEDQFGASGALTALSEGAFLALTG